MSEEHRLDPGRNGFDFLLIVAVLALCFVAVRRQFSSQTSADDSRLLMAPGTQAMDGLWRDAVNPVGKRRDMRPKAHPGMIWDEEKPEGAEIESPEPAEEPQPEVVRDDEDFEVPPLPEKREAALPVLKLEPMKETFASQDSRPGSSAFLAAPPLRPAGAAGGARAAWDPAETQSPSARASKASPSPQRLWRKPDAR